MRQAVIAFVPNAADADFGSAACASDEVLVNEPGPIPPHPVGGAVHKDQGWPGGVRPVMGRTSSIIRHAEWNYLGFASTKPGLLDSPGKAGHPGSSPRRPKSRAVRIAVGHGA